MNCHMLHCRTKHKLKCIGKTIYTRQLICETHDKVYWACTPGIGFKCTLLAFRGDRHAEVRLESDGQVYEVHMAYTAFNPAVTKGINGWTPCDQILPVDSTGNRKENSCNVYQTLTSTRKKRSK